jgi:ABC-type transport system involved in multi-copper enzyme maturation permease subunit
MDSGTVLSILMLASIAMLGGAIYLWRSRGISKQVWLMLVLALVLIANVAIWVVPSQNGTAPVQQELK